MSSDDIERDDSQAAAESEEAQKLSLEVNVESPGACQRHVTVTIARADVDRYLEKAFDELMPKAEVPGFRPGRAPRKLVQSRFKEQVEDQVKGSLLTDSLGQVSDEHEFSAISEPDFDFDAVTIPDDGPLTFEFDVEVRPDFDVPNWKGLQLKRPVSEFTDQQVDQKVKQLLGRFGKLQERKGPIESGDILDVDILASDGDRELSKLENVRVTVASELSFRDAKIPDFEQLMVGASQGETRRTNVKISEGAENELMRGRELDLALTIRSVHYIELPQLTPRFLDEIGGFEDQEDLREAVRGEMERQLHYSQQRRLREQIAGMLTQHADWALPPDLVKRQARRELERTVLELQSSGFTNDMIQQHENQIRQNSLASTERALKEHFIFERIAEDEDIDAAENDYDAEIDLIADQSNESPRRVRARLEKRGQMDALRNQIVERKVVELICSEANIADVPVDESEDDAFAVNAALASSRDAFDIPEAKHGGEAEDLRTPVDRS
jgi:trigger factor